MKERSTASWFMVLPFFAVWLVLLIWGMMNHEMWLDETHHWLLAKSSRTLPELMYNARYDGHPLLWDTILFFASRFSGSVYTMQAIHGIITSLLVLLILRKFPAPFWQRVLIIFGYFFFYEYAVISRNYSLTVLLLFLVANFWERRQEKKKLLLLLLALLMQSHLLGTISALLIGGLWFVEAGKKGKFFTKWTFAMIAVFLFSGIMVYVAAFPPADHFLFARQVSLFERHHLFSVAGMLLKGMFPLQDVASDHPWNSNWMVVHMSAFILIPALFAWFLPLLIFYRNKKAVAFFWAGALVFSLFIGYAPIVIAVRYCGFLFAWLLFVMWIFGEGDARSGIQVNRVAQAAFVFVLVIQVVAGVFMWNTDRVRPFSNGKSVAEWIMKNKPGVAVAVYEQYTGPSVAAYLGTKVYYPDRKMFGDFCDWRVVPVTMSDESLLNEAYRFADSTGKPFCLVTDHLARIPPGPPVVFRGVMRHLDERANFDGALVAAEDYYIYWITPADSL